ncbi:MAG: mechanosensitive ion channel family protein, partial [Cyanobacteria bacterium NC_groundwater_1444_Ag_S-0.65um_54_12]|nr:mechanosensitive ion channel family protein [Cyanobacteria bacterium NC_groundwater_1444_Ag_S-0.65um_54_12]
TGHVVALDSPIPTIFEPALRNILDMAQNFIGYLPQLLLGILLFGIFLRLARWIRDWTRVVVARTTAKDSGDAGLILGQIAYGIVILAGCGGAAAMMGLGLGNVLAGIGVSGIVVGFAFKDILENYLAGILLMLTAPFRIGDSIKTGEFEGTVRTISTRSTAIETPDGQLVILPNAKIYSLPLINFSAMPHKRGSLRLRVPYDRDLTAIRHEIIAFVSEIPAILHQPAPEVFAVALDATAIDLELRYWTKHDDAVASRSAIITVLKEQLYEKSMPPL